jgi:hypothetical protein
MKRSTGTAVLNVIWRDAWDAQCPGCARLPIVFPTATAWHRNIIRHSVFKRLFLGITQPCCTIVAFDMRFPTSYAEPGLKMREHLCFHYCRFFLSNYTVQLHCLQRSPGPTQLFRNNCRSSLSICGSGFFTPEREWEWEILREWEWEREWEQIIFREWIWEWTLIVVILH